MTAINLPPDLDETLRREAELTGTTVEALAADWLRKQQAALHRARLAEQTRRFWAKHAELYAQYPDEFVAFYDDAVLDHDSDVSQLALRVQTEYADLPIVIAQVTQTPVREYKVISTRLSEPSS